MVEIPGSEYEVNCQLVLIAAGFLGSEDYVTKEFKVDITDRTNVATKEESTQQAFQTYLQPEICTEASHW